MHEYERPVILEMAMCPAHEGVENGYLTTGTDLTIYPIEAMEVLSWNRDPIFSYIDHLRQHPTLNTENTNSTVVTD